MTYGAACEACWNLCVDIVLPSLDPLAQGNVMYQVASILQEIIVSIELDSVRCQCHTIVTHYCCMALAPAPAY